MFKYTEWSRRPVDVNRISNGRVIVARNVAEITRDGVTLYAGESAVMDETAYAAYVGAMAVETRRENAVIDDYTLELIEKGII